MPEGFDPPFCNFCGLPADVDVRQLVLIEQYRRNGKGGPLPVECSDCMADAYEHKADRWFKGLED